MSTARPAVDARLGGLYLVWKMGSWQALKTRFRDKKYSVSRVFLPVAGGTGARIPVGTKEHLFGSTAHAWQSWLVRMMLITGSYIAARRTLAVLLADESG